MEERNENEEQVIDGSEDDIDEITLLQSKANESMIRTEAQNYSKKLAKRGVVGDMNYLLIDSIYPQVYLSRIPPFMKVGQDRPTFVSRF
jgi:hypothetical protein